MHDRNIFKINACKSNDPNNWTQFKKKVRNTANFEISLMQASLLSQYTGHSRKTSNELRVNLGERKWTINNQSNWAFERM